MKKPGKTIEVSIENLLLDPNNPRLVHHPSERIVRAKIDDPRKQEETLQKMMGFEIKELIDSIKARGWFPVGVPIYVERLHPGGHTFVVLEGNRRITALKSLYAKLDPKANTALFRDMEALECEDVTHLSEDAKENIRAMIHQSGSLAWGLLPQSADVYRYYMKQLKAKDDNEYLYETKPAKIVCDAYDKSPGEVRDKLASFRIYRQIYEELGVDDPRICHLEKKFSIIYECVKSSIVRTHLDYDLHKGRLTTSRLRYLIRLILGEHGRDNSIIRGAAAGDDNVRDFAYVLSNAPDRVEELMDGTASSIAELKTKIKEHLPGNHSTIHSLERAAAIMARLKVYDFRDGLTKEAKGYIKDIERVLDSLKKMYK